MKSAALVNCKLPNRRLYIKVKINSTLTSLTLEETSNELTHKGQFTSDADCFSAWENSCVRFYVALEITPAMMSFLSMKITQNPAQSINCIHFINDNLKLYISDSFEASLTTDTKLHQKSED